jgi:hypothetical protein
VGGSYDLVTLASESERGPFAEARTCAGDENCAGHSILQYNERSLSL